MLFNHTENACRWKGRRNVWTTRRFISIQAEILKNFISQKFFLCYTKALKIEASKARMHSNFRGIIAKNLHCNS